MKIDLVSPHDPVAAARRLKAAVGETLDEDSPKRVTGNGTEDRMTLWVHRPNVRNDFKTVLAASVEAYRGGSRIRGRIGAPRSVGIFMGCWFTFVSLFLLFGLGVLFAARGQDQGSGLLFILIPLLMLIFGAALIWFGRMHGREDRTAILAFLTTTIGARAYRRQNP